LGSVARNVAQHASCSALVAREPAELPFQVVLGMDGSEHSRAAVELLARLPLPPGSCVRLVTVIRPPTPGITLMPVEEDILQEALHAARQSQRHTAQDLLEVEARKLTAAGLKTETSVL